MIISLIVATDTHGVIGAGNQLPWHLPSDLKRFRKLTSGNVVVAGGKTYRSILERLGKPLPDRHMVVATRLPSSNSETVTFVDDVPKALSEAVVITLERGGDELFIIGGLSVYIGLLPRVTRVYLTRVMAEVDGDTWMPKHWLRDFQLVEDEVAELTPEDEYPHRYQIYERR